MKPIFSTYRILKQYFQSILLSLGLPPHSCRFTPSCSRYCEQAYQKYGILRGSWLCFIRVIRCHPGSRGGTDPLV